ncbi:MAG: ABC transporter ATP-binding protein [Coriobacteriia bacterium]|nr:ABC transporter ATP-binding protein [Coriobacteriia bacterium]
MGPVLEVRDLEKSYGALKAVRGISFQVQPGEIFALIGPNGAGKTTTLRIVATILRPSAGHVSVAGIDVAKDPGRIREIISYLPEEAGAYKNMTGEGYLRFVAELFFADAAGQKAALARAREITDLGDRLADKLGSYSKGMTRKLLLGRTLMTEPRLAILDEPTSGLDVLNALEVRDTVRSYARGGGSAVLLSSHNMLEIEYLSDRVGLLHDGVIQAVGTPAELKERYGADNLEEVFAEVAR